MTAALVLLLMLTPAEKRGREIYFNGGSATALVAGTTELPAASLPCGSCHGPDRRGVAEGTIVPPDIRWPILSRPDLNKPRPRYDDTTLQRVITAGVDSYGRALSPVMPRYRMSAEAMSDLLAFLRRDAPDPGLTDTTITIATSAVTRDVVSAYLKDLNASGGIYGRTLRLSQSASTDDVFALVGASGVTVDPLERIPVVTPFATAATTSTSFALYADLTTQVLALASSLGTNAPVNVIVEHDRSPVALAAAAALAEVMPPRDSSPRGDNDILFLLGDVDVPAILARLDQQQWRPRILAAGTRAALPAGRRITRAAPTIPADITPDAHQALAAFATRHNLPPAQATTQLATYATMQVFTEALKRAGRDLTRESVITALEQLYDFPTGLTPPITFHRTRRIGAKGAWVVDVDGGKAPFVSAQ
jgi:hypothetical protein